MWIFQNNSFLSIVAHRTRPGFLLVRSRIQGDIERAIPGAETFEDPEADYRYRAVVPKEVVQKAIAQAIENIDYPNFKNSVPAAVSARHDAYMKVWGALAGVFGAHIESGRG